MDLPVMPPMKPMLAKPVPTLPDGDMSYEPKWDGFRCIVFRDGEDIIMGSRNEKALNRYFPEMLEPLRTSLPDRCVVDGELIVSIDGKLDFDALGQRIHPADSRVQMLARETPADFVAFDLLALGDESLVERPFGERRAALEGIAARFSPPVHLAPATTDRDVAMEWFHTTEGAGLDGLIIKPLTHPYVSNKRTQFKLKHVRSADCVVAGYRMHKSGDGVGSLILGLYSPEGQLWHVGVAASFTAKRRAELVDELAPLVLTDVADHPWSEWMDAEANADGSMPGAPNRWSGASGRDHSWTPLRIERVVEVQYTWATSGRFRGTTRMLRWRPDRDPESCSTAQLFDPEVVSDASPVSTIVGRAPGG
jgi:ATP-dependent DNA ligase